jgi:hypothetical protein
VAIYVMGNEKKTVRPISSATREDKPAWAGSGHGAGDGIRTRDINLGKVALYQLSYSRAGLFDILE